MKMQHEQKNYFFSNLNKFDPDHIFDLNAVTSLQII